jgi:lysophospholipase L1-like esterase
MSDRDNINLSLDPRDLKVVVKGRPGMSMAQLKFRYTLDLVSCNRPRLVLIDIGTNDIDAMRKSPQELAHQLYHFGIRLVERFGVKHVVFLEVMLRGPGRFSPKNPQFTTHVQVFNSCLRSLVQSQSGESRHLHCWVHSTMRTNVQQYLCDGVHLNHVGMKKYYYSVRRAVVHYWAMC